MEPKRKKGLAAIPWAAVALALSLAVFGAAFVRAAAICAAGQSCLFLPQVSTPGATATPSATAAPATPGPSPTARPPATITGLAILGDSTQDEYRANDQRGGSFGPTTLNWVELLYALRQVNLGPQGSFDEPRRDGFAYNWARSGATTGSLLFSGQHTGAAEQIGAGEVSHVLIQIGINDFNQDNMIVNIAQGRLSGDELHAALNTMAGNVEVAVETVRKAGAAKIVLATTQDYATLNLSPELPRLVDPAGIQRIVDAFAYLNQRLKLVAERQGVDFFDFNAALRAELDARRDRQGMLHVGGELIDLNRRGNDPHFGLLEDTYMHPGTVLSGLYANVYIRHMDQVFGTTLEPLSDDEILRAAGIRP